MSTMARFRRMNARQLKEFCTRNNVFVRPQGCRVYKADMLEALEERYAVSPTVFGHASIEVSKTHSLCFWEVFAQGSSRPLCCVPWRLVFIFDEEMGHSTHAKDMRAALEACLAAEPLTPEEVAEVHRRWPQTRGREPYEVDEADGVWELERAPQPRRARRAPPAPEPEPEPETRQLSLDRKISI